MQPNTVGQLEKISGAYSNETEPNWRDYDLWIHSPVNVQNLMAIKSNDRALTKMKEVANNLSEIALVVPKICSC